MAYDLVKQLYPGAPCAIGARVRSAVGDRPGSILAPRPGDTGVRVKFDGAWPPEVCDPRALAYLDGPPSPQPAWCAR